MPVWFYFQRPSNLACHNLTTTHQPPLNFRALLGLGLSFCPRPFFTSNNNLNQMLERLRTDLYNRYVYAGDNNDSYDPKLYERSNRKPPAHLVATELTTRIDNFNQALRSLFTKHRSPSNLLRHQRYCLESLRHNPHIMVCRTDKNLGPAIIDRAAYIKAALNEHLRHANTYQQLSRQNAELEMTKTSKAITAWLRKYKDIFTKGELTFLKRTHRLHNERGDIAFPQFYLLAKIHKIPMAMRPIVSVSGSLLHGLGRWTDRQLQPAGRAIPSYIQSSEAYLHRLRDLQIRKPLPATAMFFTCDAVSMYTNIPTKKALNELSTQPEHVHDALDLIMNNNVFQFSDTFWKQRSGTAMGTPPACMWATLFFASHENKLCTTYERWLLDWARYIDDGIGIWDWTGTPECIQAFDAFKKSLQEFYLTWEISQPQNTVNYLDITLSIKNGTITSDLFEKKLHLYLYLPRASAHPPGVLKGLIAGSILRIMRLASNPQTQKHHLQNFYK